MYKVWCNKRHGYSTSMGVVFHLNITVNQGYLQPLLLPSQQDSFFKCPHNNLNIYIH